MAQFMESGVIGIQDADMKPSEAGGGSILPPKGLLLALSARLALALVSLPLLPSARKDVVGS